MIHIFYYIGAYFIGNILTGALFAKLIYKSNIKIHGSGNPGARNAGRLYGKKAFAITFLGDALKGSLIIIIGRMLHFSELEQLIGLCFTVLGHIKPILFHFKGGKGISTFIGGIITFSPIAIPIIILGFFLTFPFSKSFTVSGLIALCLLPFSISYFQGSIENIWPLAILIIMLIFAHSGNLLTRIK